MKNLFAIVLVSMFALSANAGRGAKWNQYPTVGGVAVNNLCDAGDSFRTLAPVRTCAELVEVVREEGHGEVTRHTDWVCKTWATGHHVIAKSYKATVCTEVDYGRGEDSGRGCIAWAEQTQTYPNTFRVSVMQDQGEASIGEVGSFNHTVPACN